MRILIAGGIQQKNAAARYYDVAPKLINGFTRLGHTVQHFADRDISRANNWLRSRKLGIKPCNKIFLRHVEAFNPDLIIFKHADIIEQETLLTIREKWPHIKMAQVNVDALFNPDNVERIKNKSGLVDANFITTYGSALEKIKLNNKPVFYIPNPVDASIEDRRAFEENTIPNDLFLAYGSAPEGDPRREIPLNLLKELPTLKFKLCIAAEGTGLWGQSYMAEVQKSKCGLNLSRKQEKDRIGTDDDLFMYSSDRLAHYIGNGLLVFSDKAFQLDRIFSQEEMVFYKDEQDLKEKVQHYIAHDKERIKIAKAGWEKAHQEFNEQKVAQFILAATFNKMTSNFSWPMERI